MSLPNVKTAEGICVYCDGQQHLVRRENLAYKKLVELVNKGDVHGFLDLLNNSTPTKLVGDITHGRISYKNGVLYRDGKELSQDGYKRAYDIFVNRIEGLLKDGLSLKPLFAFINNLLENPSSRSVEQAYEFIERNNLPLTEDGHFLAYKSVRSNYLDKHSGTVSNKPGSNPKMPRNMVDDNPHNHCSHGYHVGALSYSGPQGWFHSHNDKVVTVKVNPKDIVSVPADHDCQKCRVCEYIVLQDYQSAYNSRVYGSKGEDVSIDSYDGVDVHSIDSIYEDEELIFVYNSKVRRGIVSHIDFVKNNLTLILSEPEVDAGSYKTFKWDLMEDVKILE